MRLPNEIEILRRIALPLLRHDLRIALDQRVLRAVPAAGGEIPDHGLIDDNHVLGLCLDLFLRFLIGFLVLTHGWSNTSGTENVIMMLPAAVAMMRSLWSGSRR